MEPGKNLTSLGLHHRLASVSGSELWPLRCGSNAVVASVSAALYCSRGLLAHFHIITHFLTNV